MVQMIPFSHLWFQANNLNFQIQQLIRQIPDKSGLDLQKVLRKDGETILLLLEEALLKKSCREVAAGMGDSMGIALKLRRDVMVSKFLGYLKEDSFRAIEEAIENILLALGSSLRQLENLEQSLNADVAYSRPPFLHSK